MNNVVIQNKKRSEKNVQKKTFRKKTTALDHTEKLKIIQLFKNKRKKKQNEGFKIVPSLKKLITIAFHRTNRFFDQDFQKTIVFD